MKTKWLIVLSLLLVFSAARSEAETRHFKMRVVLPEYVSTDERIEKKSPEETVQKDPGQDVTTEEVIRDHEKIVLRTIVTK